MKKIVLLFIILSFGAFTAYAQSNPTIYIVNDTGYTFYFLMIKPSTEGRWSLDILGDELLEDGQAFSYQLPYPLSRVSVYDFKAEDDEKDLYFKYKVRVVDSAEIVFTLDDLDWYE